MTSMRRAGRVTTFGFAVGAGLLIASGAGAAVAVAAPGDSGHASSSSSAASSASASSARSARPSSNAAAKPKPAHSASARSGYSAPVVQLKAKRSLIPESTAVTRESDIVAAVPAKQGSAKRAAALPTPTQLQQSITVGLDAARRSLDELREKIQTLVQNQIVGFRDNLVTLRIDLDRLFHPNRQIIYGNVANSQYWAAGGAQTSGLMAAAMVISKLTGQTVTAQDIIAEATSTDSVAQPGRKMYLGTATNDWVWALDSVQLMETHGLKVSTVYYSKSQQQRAWNGLLAGLSDGKSVIVSISGDVRSAIDGNTAVWNTEHQAVLLGINISKNLVYLNDGAYPGGGGQNLTMSIDDFLDAWQAGRYTAIFAELAPATAQAIASEESLAA
ncbi:C39 family peptidase [Mycolicibacterium aichiense]|nr:C39 family peptidase [Mycolicibacterium aichiense]